MYRSRQIVPGERDFGAGELREDAQPSSQVANRLRSSPETFGCLCLTDNCNWRLSCDGSSVGPRLLGAHSANGGAVAPTIVHG
jgi:hypothetical protein